MKKTPAYEGDIHIPNCAQYKNVCYPVEISYDAFTDCPLLTSVTIDDGIESIPQFSNCPLLKSVSFSAGTYLKSIGGFNNCPALESITFPSTKLESIGSLYHCDLIESLVIPDCVTYFGGCSVCEKLISVTLPDNLNSVPSFTTCSSLVEINIPSKAKNFGKFTNCSSLKSITIPSGVSALEENAFKGCDALEKVYITDMAAWCGIEFNNEYSNPLYYAKELYLNNEKVTDVVVPGTVAKVKSYAFYNYSALQSVTFSEGVTTIGAYAFQECTSLSSVTMASTVNNIGLAAFWKCDNITKVSISNIASWCNISFPNWNSNPLYYAKHLYLNDQEIVDLNVPAGVTSIGSYAFINCEGLTNVVLPNSLVSIGNNAFAYTGLSIVDVPATVSSIGSNAFSDVLNIRYLGGATGAPWGARSVNGYKEGDLIFEDDTKGNILTCDPDVEGTIEIPNSVKTISAAAFSGCKKVTAITLPDGLDSIAESAFYFCFALNTINIPATVRTIGQQAFTGCFSLTSVAIPSTDISIGYLAFTYVPNVEYPGSPGYLSWGARSVNGYVEGHWVYADNTKTVLRACSAVAQGEVTIPSSVTKIQTYNTTVPAGAFYYCTQITSLTCHAVTPLPLGYNTFSGMDCANIPLYVPLLSVDDYKLTEQWNEFNPILPIQTTTLDQTSQEPIANSQKLLINGQLLILRDGKTYNVMGAEVK